MSSSLLKNPKDLLGQRLRLVFEAWELPVERIPVGVERMLEADPMGIDSHGIAMTRNLRGLAQSCKTACVLDELHVRRGP